MRLGIRSLALGDMMGRSESRDWRGMAGCGKTGLQWTMLSSQFLWRCAVDGLEIALCLLGPR